MKNILKKVEEFKNMFNAFNMSIGNAWLSKNNGAISKLSQNPFYPLRDSINYRVNAIAFHIHNLLNVNETCMKEQSISTDYKSDSYRRLQRASDIGTYLFDDLIFNIVSLIDYYGCLLGYIYFNDINKKHNGFMNSLNDGKLTQSQLPEYLRKEHKQWINDLFEYRSKIIHKRSFRVEPEHITQIGINNELKRTMNIYLPKSFVTKLSIFQKKEKVEIKDAINTINDTLFDYLKQIIEIIMQEASIHKRL